MMCVCDLCYCIIFLRRNSPQFSKVSSLSMIHDHTHLDTPQSVGLLWTSDQPVAEISTQCNLTDRKWGRFISSVWSLIFLLLPKLYIWVDRTDLFKISKLVYGARVIVTRLYGSLQGQRHLMTGIES